MHFPLLSVVLGTFVVIAHGSLRQATGRTDLVAAESSVPTQSYCSNVDPNTPLCVRSYLFSGSKQPYAQLGLKGYGYLVNGAGYGEYGYASAPTLAHVDFAVNITDSQLKTVTAYYGSQVTYWNNSYAEVFVGVNDVNSDISSHGVVTVVSEANSYAGTINYVNLLDDGSSFYFEDYNLECVEVSSLSHVSKNYYTSSSGITMVCVLMHGSVLGISTCASLQSDIKIYATSTCTHAKRYMTCTISAGTSYYIPVYGSSASSLSSEQVFTSSSWCVVHTSSSSKKSTTLIIILAVVFGGVGLALAVGLICAECRRRRLHEEDEDEDKPAVPASAVVASTAPVPVGFEMVDGHVRKIRSTTRAEELKAEPVDA
jgi:hypothetical protein